MISKCPVCGKCFYSSISWLYKTKYGKRVCSYKCSCISDEVNKSRKIRNKIEENINESDC